MVMDTMQIRLTKELIEKIDELVEEGIYPNRSEAVRDAVRRLISESGEHEEFFDEGGDEGGEGLPEHVRELRKYTH